MKLFMILYTFNHIGGVFGPLPYDMNECLFRAANLNTEYHEKASAYKGKPLFAYGKQVGPDSMKFVCEMRNKAPDVEEAK